MAGRAKDETRLRRGWTTGACATAAARAAYVAMVSGTFPDPVTITLPKGQRPSFALARRSLGAGAAQAGIVKDAGDDPDVTHGALVVVTIAPGAAGSGVAFAAGEGVGTVTRPGLPLPVGEPAINPAPRAMIRDAIVAEAAARGTTPDVLVTVSIPGGEALAERTWNPRLGIRGGLSILGTTGVVVPYSCSAWIHAIHRGIDVARASGIAHVAGCTGSTSERAVRRAHGLGEEALVDMGDFAGGMLKYLRRHPVPRVTVGGGFAKLSKLACGHLDLHSSRSQVDAAWLAAEAHAAGADDALVATIEAAPTALEAWRLADARGVALADRVAAGARETAAAVTGEAIVLDVLVVDRAGVVIGRSGP